MSDPNPQLSIIIVSWNVSELLRSCLQSIREQTKISHEIIVIDNASTDGSADMVAHEFPQAKLIRNSRNRGFGAANNQGLAKASGEFVIFLNDDTVILDQALDKMVNFLKQSDSVGIVGARLLNPDKTIQVGTARRFPNFKILATMLLGLHSFFRKKKWLQAYYLTNQKFQKTQSVDQVMGASLMTRRQLLKNIGSFDEHFWIWFEEVDLCKRFRDSGYKIAVLATAEIIHHKGQSFAQQIKLKKFCHLSRSLIIYSYKHLPLYQPLLLILLWPIGFLNALLIQIFNLKPRPL
jgi:GT2 family glycosyltransferase